MIDSRYLTFIELASSLSFTQAAKKLGFTQPAVSQHLKQLEAQFGTKLFNREKKQLSLTKEGEILLKYAKRMAALEKNLTRKMEDYKRGASSLTIGITHSSESTVTPEILASYAKEHGEVRIHIVSDSVKGLFEKLSSFEIDMAIIEGKISHKKFSSFLLSHDELLLIVPSSSPLASKEKITLEELSKERIILRDYDSGTTTLFKNALSEFDMDIDDLHVALELENVATIKDLVKKGLGISVLPHSACLEEIKEGTLKALPIEGISISRDISLVYIPGNIDKEVLESIYSLY